jgi:hypothetical protein
VAGVRRAMVGVLSPDSPDVPLLREWVLSRSSPAERRLSALQPRRLACGRRGSSVRPAPRHPLQLQLVETPSQSTATPPFQSHTATQGMRVINEGLKTRG